MLKKLNPTFDYYSQLFSGCETSDLSDDYTLPDYMPAVGRVISCSASVTPPTLYLVSNSIELAGGVRYHLLYESADDKSVWCAELPAEYDALISADPSHLPSDPAKLSGLTSAIAESVTARITAPRRLTVKSRIKLTSSLSAKTEFGLNMRGELNDTDSIRVLEGRADHSLTVNSLPKLETLTDRITRAEAGLSPTDEVRVITSHGYVMLSQIAEFDGGADCKGEISLSLLICKDEEGDRPRRITRRLPFSISVSFEPPLPANAKPIGSRAYGALPSINTTVGDEGIDIEADLLLFAESSAVSSFTYVKDMYSRTADCEVSHEAISIMKPLFCKTKNATVSASADLSELGFDHPIRICDVVATLTPDIDTKVNENGRLVISGKQRFNVVADNGAELLSKEFIADFKYTADGVGAIPDEVQTSVIATVSDCRFRVDAGHIECDSELCFAISVAEKCEIAPLCEVNVTPLAANDSRSASIRICYPSASETLWDLAKRYRVDTDMIAKKNAIDATDPTRSALSLTKESFLII